MIDKEQILDRALQLGAEKGWEKLTLNQLADSLSIPLADIYRHYRQKDELVDAWFDRADWALLSQVEQANSITQSKAQKLEQAILRWLDALAPYRKLTGSMLMYKLEPGHIHLQAAGVLRISRTVQWFREAADLKASHLKRIGQELMLTQLYLATFAHWLTDNSLAQQRTRQLLKNSLSLGDKLGLWR